MKAFEALYANKASCLRSEKKVFLPAINSMVYYDCLSVENTLK